MEGYAVTREEGKRSPKMVNNGLIGKVYVEVEGTLLLIGKSAPN